MRVIHLCFQLRLPEGGDSEKTERESFDKFNHDIVQPFLALLERNFQRYEKIHLSLLVMGEVWERAECFDPDIITRLKKMATSGNIELIVTPFYQTWSFYYDQEEFLDQIVLCQEKIQRDLGVNNPVLASTKFDYSDELAAWSEQHGFAVVLARLPQSDLGWRSANHVYEAPGCEYLRVLLENERITELLQHADTELIAWGRDPKRSETNAKSLSLAKFQRCLDLEWLRGNLINIFLDAEIFARLREVGISSFFDEMFRVFQKDLAYRFVNASEACVFKTPLMMAKAKSSSDGSGKSNALRETMKADLPGWLSDEKQKALIERLRMVRAEIWRRGDRELKMAYHRLEKAEALEGEGGLGLALDDLLASLPAIEPENVTAAKVDSSNEVQHDEKIRHDDKAQDDDSGQEIQVKNITPSRKTKTSQKAVAEEDQEGAVVVHFEKNDRSQRAKNGRVSDRMRQAKINQDEAEMDTQDGVVEVRFLKKAKTVVPSSADEETIKINFVKKTPPRRQRSTIARPSVGRQPRQDDLGVVKTRRKTSCWVDGSERAGTKNNVFEDHGVSPRERLERELMANVRAELEEEILLQEQAQRAHRDRIIRCVEKAEEAQVVVPKRVDEPVVKTARTSLKHKIIRRSLVIE